METFAMMFRSVRWRVIVPSCALSAMVISSQLLVSQEAPKAPEAPADAFPIPAGLGELKYPENNLADPRKVALGQQLYFEPRLSSDGKVSCATCHDPKHGWADPNQFSTGIDGLKGNRNSPTVINSAYSRFQFWDGRAATLEEQALGPIENPVEMNMPIEKAIETLNGIEGYRKQFNEIFGTDVTRESLALAIAAYERTILSGDAPYDRFKAGDKTALSEAAQRGMKLFFGAANCSACHSGPNFTDHAFHNLGVGMDKPEPDVGRFAISKLEGDTGAFKTPTLREIAQTAPYMHDGSMKTLEEVVEHYNKGGIPNDYLDEEVFELGLTKEQVADLVTFMKEGLSSESCPMHECPELPE